MSAAWAARPRTIRRRLRPVSTAVATPIATMTSRPLCLALLAALATACSNAAEPVGEVDTVFKLIGPDHKIVVEAYDDPDVEGVTCYVSRA